MRKLLVTNRALVVGLILTLLGVALGIFSHTKEIPLFWNRNVLLDFAGWISCCFLVAGFLNYRSKHTARTLFLVSIGAYFVFGVGLEQSAAVILLATSSIFYGKLTLDLIFAKNIKKTTIDLKLIIGLAVQLTIFGILIHFGFNYRWVYLLILSIPIFLTALSKSPKFTHSDFIEKINTSKTVFVNISYWYFVVMVALVGAVARYVFFPSIGADDNALHLGMWTQLTQRGVYGFDVASQIWSVAPFAVDILHSIVSLIAGTDARSALNLLILTLLLRQLWFICASLELLSSDRLLVIVLFVSTPMLSNLLVTLQTELFLAFLATSGVLILLSLQRAQLDENYVAIFAIAAMSSATKLPGVVLGALLVSAAALITLSNFKAGSLGKIAINKLWSFVFLIMIFFVTINSYGTAWKITGNPFFPLYNAIFKSAYFPQENFSDLRYITGFSLISYWNIFFKTSSYFESKDFVAGFQYLLLFPLALLAMLWKVNYKLKIIILVPLFGFGVTMFSATQYWRYMFPVLPLATVVIGTLLASKCLAVVTTTRFVIAAYVAINFYFLPGISWFFVAEPQQAYTFDGRQEITKQFAPTKLLTSFVNEYPDKRNARVLYSGENFGATLEGYPIYGTWYSPSRQARMSAVRKLEDVATIINDEKIDFVIWDLSLTFKQNDARWLLRQYLSEYGVPERQIGNHVLYRITKLKVQYREVFNSNSITENIAQTVNNTLVTSTPRLIGRSAIQGGSIARYHVDFKCNESGGFFIALVSFDVGAPYYRSISCSLSSTNFTESFIVPLDAARADIYSTTLDSSGASAAKVTLEIQ